MVGRGAAPSPKNLAPSHIDMMKFCHFVPSPSNPLPSPKKNVNLSPPPFQYLAPPKFSISFIRTRKIELRLDCSYL